jgi:hypothetical protein
MQYEGEIFYMPIQIMQVCSIVSASCRHEIIELGRMKFDMCLQRIRCLRHFSSQKWIVYSIRCESTNQDVWVTIRFRANLWPPSAILGQSTAARPSPAQRPPARSLLECRTEALTAMAASAASKGICGASVAAETKRPVICMKR